MTPIKERLVDRFGRVHNNLRISVTDRCNIRCVYCMPEVVQFLPKAELLTFEEIERVVVVAARLGIDKIRLTGGEPLIRRGLPALIARIVAVPGIRDVGLTTNGLLLGSMADDLRAAGLTRLNVSLDTLDPARFLALTRREGLERVVEGILAAKLAGFHPIKLNALAIKGVTEDDVVPLARFARQHGLELRFIEYMPLDAGNLWERNKVLLADEILERITCEVGPLIPVSGQDAKAPALEYLYGDGGGKVGMIASVSRPFCASCNRMRLTSDGKLRNCLFALDEMDLRPLLRSGGTDEELTQALQSSVADKWEGHEINTARFIKPERLMHAIGG